MRSACVWHLFTWHDTQTFTYTKVVRLNRFLVNVEDGWRYVHIRSSFSRSIQDLFASRLSSKGALGGPSWLQIADWSKFYFEVLRFYFRTSKLFLSSPFGHEFCIINSTDIPSNFAKFLYLDYKRNKAGILNSLSMRIQAIWIHIRMAYKTKQGVEKAKAKRKHLENWHRFLTKPS